MIEVNQISKSFGATKAVSDMSFAVPFGEITGLLGPNGAGKSTCIRIISGIMTSDRGNVQIGGVDPKQDPLAVQEMLGVLGDKRSLYTRLTAKENIEYYGRLRGIENKILEHRIQELSRELEMKDILHRRTEGFSTGQKVKVALARTLVHDPKYIILDEPTAGLDVMSTRALRDLIRGLKTESRAVVFCSHVMQEVDEVCDRLVVVSRGEAVFEGRRQEFCQSQGVDSIEEAFVRAVVASSLKEDGA